MSACLRMCVYVCLRQCVTSRKLLSADLHCALFPLSWREKQASFARQRERGKTRQMAIPHSAATCGYNILYMCTCAAKTTAITLTCTESGCQN